jgi:hypothetical protein
VGAVDERVGVARSVREAFVRDGVLGQGYAGRGKGGAGRQACDSCVAEQL